MQAITYFSIVIPNKPGEGARMLAGLKEAGVNLRALWGYPIKGGKAIADLAPEDPKAFAKAAKKLKIAIDAKRTAIYLNGADEPGALGEALMRLAVVGVNVRAAQAISSGEGRFGALIQVAPEDEKKAKKALGIKGR
jgi:hypothetical protein